MNDAAQYSTYTKMCTRGTVSKMGEMVDVAVVRLPSLFTKVARCQCEGVQ